MTSDEAKQKLIDAGLILEMLGQGDMARGHISVRMPGDPGRFYMKPHTFGFDEMTMDNIVTCNLEGEKVEGWAPRHSEVYIHSEIFRARPDVTSVMHAHSTWPLAFSATGRPLKVYTPGGAAFCDGLPVFTDTNDLIRKKEQGAAVARTLGPHSAVLLKNHGLAIATGSLEETVVTAYVLEEACRVQLLIEAAGSALPEFAREDIAVLKKKVTSPEQYVINFEYLRRKVRRASGK